MMVIGHIWEIVNALTHTDVNFSFWHPTGKFISLLYPSMFAIEASL